MDNKKWRNLGRLCIVLFFCFCIGFIIGIEITKQQRLEQGVKPPSAYELLEKIEDQR